MVVLKIEVRADGGEEMIEGAPGRDGSGFGEEVQEEFFGEGRSRGGIPVADDESGIWANSL